MSRTYFNIRKFEPSGAGQLSVSWHWLLFFFFFGLSYCSWGSCGENTEVVCHSLLQWTMFCQNLPLWRMCFGWPWTTWLIDSLSYASPFATTRCMKGLNSMDTNLSKLQETWRTGKHGVLQSMGSQRGGHDLVTEQQLSDQERQPENLPGKAIMWILLMAICSKSPSMYQAWNLPHKISEN